ncbi:MAG: DUF924 domain-containing protein [gamma proteobacterium symbiont of Bathyaustriella thionipta]|nr:DUF924 domain-containing protein [gamma proteobacterium symbiont of Bathyaustriella thionipta]MCU7949205.1 DUF924 domain-containing protein [gamma proteobacterium symbiont of Bathyaustriella thionipta]MCU7954897.1 DUF924 domain-containing protein [gamma proteobacterium symbiont of Bathyaustriella thionipta]MCU7955772.1 DUF924 domain-containing protein [gamma proteobacterium symbiont of Bathyaustriella thionipta]MCU7966007.1 DUF924 domain-containing protein [gamma proteobacterium symbiont of 
MTITAEMIIDFWYGERIKKHWFQSTPELDNEIRDKFEALWVTAAAGALNHWAETAEGALALVIILDQFPLNMFRNQAKSFQTEQLAVQVSRQAIDKGLDAKLAKNRLSFLYMPLMHSENLDDQALCVHLFEQAELDANIRFSRHHRDIIQQFGRFPHRNRILKRQSTQQELDYLNSKHAFKG